MPKNNSDENNSGKNERPPAEFVVELVGSLRQQINHHNHQYTHLTNPGFQTESLIDYSLP
jgi:hypothetical protein